MENKYPVKYHSTSHIHSTYIYKSEALIKGHISIKFQSTRLSELQKYDGFHTSTQKYELSPTYPAYASTIIFFIWHIHSNISFSNRGHK